ncbi:hypothetical protein BN1058_01699 [Paraliobacillus sp. PM-2]|uniref:DUF3173 family protein n=1 Tax=Paraliobacillus sp. PM-2 TaxID=1462524 RepID=UPI00061C1D94|nr:DUF3173 family protein [Paraliobacillus sp. PM-2]CQR47388.1 hypothetical protein BN1058_01699 [Paraliobacillus sp. PM-2]
MKGNFSFIKKVDLMQVGFNENTASEVIRCVKRQLAQEGLMFYDNPRTDCVLTDRVIEFLLGVPGNEEAYQNPIKFLTNELVHRDELIAWGIPKAVASELIKEAQQIMAMDGYIFYQNTRRWFAPSRLIKQLLGGK